MESVLLKIAEAAVLVNDRLPAGRERSMVLTKLDEARLWCKDIKIMTEPSNPIPALDEILKDAPSEKRKEL